ncbi:MAG TPA: carboxypeptidase-like regulatory domain-containing protein [Terriglobales bacterium]|nr:carboxypeptidase-like regulatory domain-containing protein [Terriglobales bacterium]
MPQCLNLKRVGFLLALLAGAGLVMVTPGLTPAAMAQAATGTVTGQITDAQGAAMVGAVVTLTNTATNGTQATIANAAGRYVFVNVQPGTYTLNVKKEGFKEAAVKNQAVDVNKQLTLNVAMEVGTATQTVEVSATGAELQTMNSTVGTTITGDAIVKLPNLGRDANALSMLQPNVAPDGGVAGAVSDQNSYTLDGSSNSDDMDGAHNIYTPSSGSTGSGAGGIPSGVIPTPADSIEQFSVGVNNQTADFNGAAGSQVAMVTKRGTTAMHGSAYEYYLGSYLAANSWENNQAGTARPKSHQNRYGASLGGEILPNFLGGKTFLFGNFEARRFPSSTVITRAVPSDLLRAGVIQSSDGSTAYNLLNHTVTVNGKSYAPAVCNHPDGTTGACDPRGFDAVNPVVSQLWKQFEPEPTSFVNDAFNTENFIGSANTPLKSNFFVARLDHDFGAKNHATVSYHFYSYNPTTTNQIDIGGGIPGDTKGVPVATTQRPQLPSMWTAGLTTSVTSNLTNDLHYTYLRNFWQWAGTDVAPQPVTGFALGGSLEIGGETSNALIPYNVNTQSVRTRFWDGINNEVRDEMTLIHGNHILQFGGTYGHDWDYHQRNDNGGGIMAANVYQITGGQGVTNAYTPVNLVGSVSTYKKFYNEVLGIVNQPQTLYTRSGPQLNLQPLGTPMFDQSTIPTYSAYLSDSWHVKPNLTATFGTSYTVSMPPVEALGKQVGLVDQAGNPISTADYLSTTARFASGGQIYNPTLGFATVQNIGGGEKYPYKPFYGGLSPRVALAWNPSFKGGLLGELFGNNNTVVRGGWSRIYGRLNGVDLVLVPLLGTGLGQAIACLGANNGKPNSAGVVPGQACNGIGGADPMNAFRIGPTSLGYDGLSAPIPAATPTLPQPYYPGTVQNGVLNPASGSGEFLDPNFRPNRSDEFDLTIQRQINSNFSTEVGYTGRVIRNEYQQINLDAVPTMLTAGGQQFKNAFANMWLQLAAGKTTMAPQSFFETALGGSGSAYCKAFANCTTAVATKEVANGDINVTQGNDVYTMWSNLNRSSSWTLGSTTPSTSGQMQAVFANLSNGYGNYNSVFWTLTMRNWHNLTATSNFTYGRSLGTGAVVQASSSYTVSDPFNLHAMYGPQGNDTPLLYNAYIVWEPGSKTQRGLIGHLAHGWSFAPIFNWNDGQTTYVNIGGDCASFGETDCNAGGTNENAVRVTGFTGGHSSQIAVSQNAAGESAGIGTNSDAANGGSGLNRFGANAAAIYAEFRPIVLGLDTTSTSGMIPDIPVWNVDFAVTKDLALSERFGSELSAQATNVFNHFSPGTNQPDIQNPQDFGAVVGNNLRSRAVEIGLRIHW